MIARQPAQAHTTPSVPPLFRSFAKTSSKLHKVVQDSAVHKPQLDEQGSLAEQKAFNPKSNSPLIKAHTHAQIICELKALYAWCFGPPSSNSKHHPAQFGALHHISLFRSRKLPFHHEYIVATFSSKDGERWCIRLERGAMTATLHVDSFKALIGGIAPYELASFSLSEAKLSQHSDVIASISTTSHIPLDINLVQFLDGVRGASTIHPKYGLLSTNCRWFSRRIILNIAEWYKSSATKPSVLWNGSSIPFDNLPSKLGDETFGGRQLKEKSAQSDIHNLAVLAAATALRGELSAAHTIYSQSLTVLQNTIKHSIVHHHPKFAAAAIDWTKQMNNTHAPAPPPLIHTILSPITMDSYVTTLWALGRKHEAWGCLRNAVKLSCMLGQLVPANELAYRLEKLVDYAARMGIRTPGTTSLLVQIHHWLYSEDYAQRQARLAKTLIDFFTSIPAVRLLV